MTLDYSKYLKNRIILITGGTGSFGNALVAKLLEYSPKKIIIFSRDEKKQEDMRLKFENPVLKFVIGDVRDGKRVDEVMERVDYVFHAAALKQVPTCEFFPMEAVKTNIFGTYNVIQAAVHHKVKKVVFLSTDKAMYPLNAMGMSKALAEKVLIAQSREIQEKPTVLCGVRYGNVLYTRGSVIPLFVTKIQQGEKLPVTHPDMTRFLLTLDDALDLVLYALVKGENGCMYVRKSPASTMDTLAKALCKMFKYEIGYQVIGIRPGEKMHETLVPQEEMARADELNNYFKIPPESQGLDYNRYLIKGEKAVAKTKPYTSENTIRLTLDQVIVKLENLSQIKENLSDE